MNYLEKLLNDIKKVKEYYFINDDLLIEIKKSIKNHFPRLNDNDKNILFLLTVQLIDLISFHFNFKKEKEFYNQWKQNNNKDIKAVVLLLLPFLDDSKDNGKVLYFEDLNEILANTKKNNISSEILNEERSKILKKHFYYSNIFIEFIKRDNNKKNFDLVINNERVINNFLFFNYVYLVNTIRVMSNKLFINWFNIQPYTFDNYKDEIYERTNLDVQNLISNFNLDNFIKILDNNVGIHFSNIYGVLRNFIYENLKKIKWTFFCFNKNESKGYYYIQLLDKYLDINLINSDSYFNLSDKEKIKFKNNLNLALNNLKNKKFIIDYEIEIDLFKTILIYLVSNYNDKNRLNSKLKKFNLENIGNLDEQDNIYQKIKKLDFNEFINGYDLLDIVDLWIFIKDSVESLKYNYFGRYLFIDNKINHDFYYLEGNLNLKNIYNYAKYVSILKYENNLIYEDKDFFKISHEQKFNIFKKIFFYSDVSGNNFNLTNNLKIQFNNKVPIGWFNNIKQNIKKILIEFIFEVMIYNGIYTKFVPNIEYTNINLPDKRKHYADNIKKILASDELKNGYYFMNNKQFKKLNVFHKNKLTHYFNRLSDINWIWYTQYAMDWISQINFFNHLLHLNLIYITGATGQGKTTQMPKLFCYGYKALFFNPAPKILHTQPRFDPTENQIKRISAEMGLDVEQEEQGKRIITENYFLQFKHSRNEHIKDNCYHPTILMMTDGTFLEILNRNLNLMDKYYFNGKWIENNQSKYDIVLIDEAHEHNKNMDLILSLLKYTINDNKDITLAIVSATMDDDEPIYRAFYNPTNHREFNYMLDYLDKRFHISPPGGTTQYKITEYYPYTTENENFILAEFETRNRIIDTVRFILQSSSKGQILIFTVGQAEIIDLVNKINNNTPNNVICLPFYSAMNQKYKEIIKDIDKELSRIKNFKNNISEQWGIDFIQDINVPNNIYDRAIIIATNVAEASITIPGLKFVIDNGFAKENKFNKILNSSNLVIEPISEASRLQRKGRVGRNDTGIVYYMYPKGSREKIMPKYKIVSEDFRETFLNVLVNNNEATDIIHNNKKALDVNGIFYLIHPFENTIKRNIINNILIDNEIVNRIPEARFTILQSLLFNMLIVSKQNNKYYINLRELVDKNYNLVPTKLLNASNIISGKLKIERNYSIILLMSHAFGKLNNGIKLIHGIEMVEKNILMIFDKKYFENYSDSFSDINTLVNILTLYDRFLPKNYFEILNFIENSQDLIDIKLEDLKNKEFFKKYYLEYKNLYLKFKNNKDKNYFNIFKKLENKNLIDSSKGFLTFIKESNILQKDLTQNINQNYILFSEQNNVKPEIILNYFKKSIETLIKLFLLDIDINKNNKEENYIYLFKTKLRKIFLKYINYYGFENEINHLILLISYFNNFSVRLKNLDYNYINVHTGQIIDVKKTIFKNEILNLSYVKNTGDFIIYIKNLSNNYFNNFSLYFNVNPKLIATFMPHCFNKDIFFNYIRKDILNIKTNRLELQNIYKLNNSLNLSYLHLFNYTNYDNNPFFDDFFEELSKALKNLKKNQ